MSYKSGWLACVAPLALLHFVSSAALAADARGRAELSYQADVRPLLAKYCFDCHGGGKGKPKAGINLAAVTGEDGFDASRKLWKQTWDVLHGQEMPPDDQPQPSAAERAQIVQWVEAMRHRLPPGGRGDPGRLVVRRLTRTEYSNTVCDLFPTLRPPAGRPYFDPAKGFPAEGVQIGTNTLIERYREPVVELPPDDADQGFDGIGENMTLSPLLMEKYLVAANEVLDKAQVKKDPRLFVARPGPKKPKRDAAREVIAALAPRAFRRPVSPEEIEKYLKLFDLADSRGEEFEAAVKLPLQGILVSPNFLLRLEREPLPSGAVAAADGVRPVGDFELATRLSYFLWSTMPDDALIELARQGKLRHPEVLDAQVKRMLQSPRSKALADNFSVQWLQLGAFETAMPDPELFPVFYEDSYLGLRWTMRQEAAMFFEVLQLENRSILELIDADWAVLSGGLAQFYGITDMDGRCFAFGKEVTERAAGQWMRYKLPDRRRGGVLTMAAVLTNTSIPTRTSAVKRGEWVLETILGQKLPPPPPNAGTLKEEPTELGKLTFRQRLDRHRADAACASCHRRLDPLGFGLEQYDAMGRFREKEGPLPPHDGDQAWDFNVDGNYESWNCGMAGGHFKVSGGTLQGRGPNMTIIYGPRVSKNAAKVNKITVRLKNDSDLAQARLLFVTDATGPFPNIMRAPFSHTNSKLIPVQPHSDFTEYTFDMSDVKTWKGTITGLRLDLVKAVGDYEIDWIRMTGPAGGVPVETAVDATATLPGGKTFRGIEELKTVLLTERKDDFVRAFTGHLLTYALGRKVQEEDAPAVERIVRAAEKDDYRICTLVKEVIRSDPFQYRRSKEFPQ